MTAASDPDILAGVERWARVRRDPAVQSVHGHRLMPVAGLAYGVALLNAGVDITTWRYATDRPHLPWLPVESWTVSLAIALAWALLVETEAGPVDVGRCPACAERGGPMVWSYGAPGAQWAGEQAWNVGIGYTTDKGHDVPAITRPCRTCRGSGRETIPAARLLLDSASSCDPCRDTSTVGPAEDMHPCPNCAPRQALRAHADHLQAIGDPRGELLAHAPGPWSGEPVDCGECPDCKGRGTVPGDPPSWANPYGEPPEDCGCGDGRLFGHPGTADALRWLEWLTWAREFAAEREQRGKVGLAPSNIASPWPSWRLAGERWGG
jgi:hypothetical protein